MTDEQVSQQESDRRPGGAPDAIVPESAAGGQSTLTVWVAFAANLVIAVAKSGAALLTGSASLVAESAHSWADTGNEIFLLVADRKSRRHPEPASDFFVGYLVLALAFVVEGISFLQSVRQARAEAAALDLDMIQHVLATSDPTLRAVFAEDSAALVGVLIAAAGLAGHQLTGSPVPDAIGSILVGVLLGVVAVLLINRNRWFLVGQEADPRVRRATLQALLDLPEVDRVTLLRLEFVGPQQLYVVADVDLTGDDTEPALAVRLRDLEARVSSSPAVVATTLGLSAPDEPSLQP